ncbi:unnamed protein product [Prorocentrum cordatum]|uniref:Uncharacterized protein n=1 Tax=Prorocentrum cordatum TaxID=2364126 RepID=A0ABN9X1E7_9DINO|nr:unnamed protein product [Polarella glacialis]
MHCAVASKRDGCGRPAEGLRPAGQGKPRRARRTSLTDARHAKHRSDEQKTGPTQDGMVTSRGGLRGPPARHARWEARALARDLTKATCARLSAQTNSFFCVAQLLKP